MPLQVKFETIELNKKSQPIARFNEMQEAIEDALSSRVSYLLEKSFKERMKGWKKPPHVYHKTTVKVGSIVLDIGPRAGGRWEWLTLGVKSRFILPRRARVLRFKTAYIPKTLPKNRLTGGPGKYIGNEVYADLVSWPGIEARQFEKYIIEETEDEIFRIIKLAIESV